jgi:hypothetical protein
VRALRETPKRVHARTPKRVHARYYATTCVHCVRVHTSSVPAGSTVRCLPDPLYGLVWWHAHRPHMHATMEGHTFMHATIEGHTFMHATMEGHTFMHATIEGYTCMCGLPWLQPYVACNHMCGHACAQATRARTPHMRAHVGFCSVSPKNRVRRYDTMIMTLKHNDHDTIT